MTNQEIISKIAERLQQALADQICHSSVRGDLGEIFITCKPECALDICYQKITDQIIKAAAEISLFLDKKLTQYEQFLYFEGRKWLTVSIERTNPGNGGIGPKIMISLNRYVN